NKINIADMYIYMYISAIFYTRIVAPGKRLAPPGRKTAPPLSALDRFDTEVHIQYTKVCMKIAKLCCLMSTCRLKNHLCTFFACALHISPQNGFLPWRQTRNCQFPSRFSSLTHYTFTSFIVQIVF